MEVELSLLDNAAATSGDFTLQVKGRGGTYFAAGTEATLTAPGACVVALGAGQAVRVAVSGGSPSGLYAILRGVNV